MTNPLYKEQLVLALYYDNTFLLKTKAYPKILLQGYIGIVCIKDMVEGLAMCV